MYILKNKGKGKIADHIQVRDADFALIAYFNACDLQDYLSRTGFHHKSCSMLQDAISAVPYGKIVEIHNL